MEKIGIFAGMNHGRCKNCWWYKDKQETRLVGDGRGICFMHSTGIGAEGCELYNEVTELSWCPDYYNRKNEKISLDDWIESCYSKKTNRMYR